MGTRQITLKANDIPVEIDYFVWRYVDHIVGGIVPCLHSTGDIQTVDLPSSDENTILILNKDTVQMNSFVQQIVRNTVEGIVSSLKGIEQKKIHSDRDIQIKFFTRPRYWLLEEIRNRNRS